MNNEELSLKRSTVRAAWFGAITGFCSLLIIAFSFFYTYWINKKAEAETVRLEIKPAPSDYATQIQSLQAYRGPTSGTISAYWELIFYNNSKKNISLVGYKLEDIGPTHNYIYEGLDQGLYLISCSSTPLPLTIDARGWLRIYIRVGLLMDGKAFGLVRDSLGFGSNSLCSIMELLYSHGIDFYGNEVVRIPGGRYWLPGLKIKDQTFFVTFVTAEGTTIEGRLSWYDHSRPGSEHLWLCKRDR